MNSRKVTLAGLVLILLIAAAVEVYSLANPAPGDTISEIVWGLSAASPLFVFVCGVLAGHFWFPKGACVHCGKRPWAKDPAPASKPAQAFHDFGKGVAVLEPGCVLQPIVPRFCAHCGTVAEPKRSTKCLNCGAPLEAK